MDGIDVASPDLASAQEIGNHDKRGVNTNSIQRRSICDMSSAPDKDLCTSDNCESSLEEYEGTAEAVKVDFPLVNPRSSHITAFKLADRRRELKREHETESMKPHPLVNASQSKVGSPDLNNDVKQQQDRLSIKPSDAVPDQDELRMVAKTSSPMVQEKAAKKPRQFGNFIHGPWIHICDKDKVRLGWGVENNIQVVIKSMARPANKMEAEQVSAQVHREARILQKLHHPNIVHMHDVIETEKSFSIVLEYASGGTLFEHIKSHQYFKDPAARRLFAQLISAVDYLHKSGMAHLSLTLHNVLLDHNQNIVIGGFTYANTFNAGDELPKEVEDNLQAPTSIKKVRLDVILSGGHRRGDLMNTKYEKAWYAAPEMVIGHSLHSARKADIWSCGVILYTLLAGFLPFDSDDLVYTQIAMVWLRFPEYVTPDPKDLLRRVLVPDPRRRADLFEIARHSWLSEYSDILDSISSTTNPTISSSVQASFTPNPTVH